MAVLGTSHIAEVFVERLWLKTVDGDHPFGVDCSGEIYNVRRQSMSTGMDVDQLTACEFECINHLLPIRTLTVPLPRQ